MTYGTTYNGHTVDDRCCQLLYSLSGARSGSPQLQGFSTSASAKILSLTLFPCGWGSWHETNKGYSYEELSVRPTLILESVVQPPHYGQFLRPQCILYRNQKSKKTSMCTDAVCTACQHRVSTGEALITVQKQQYSNSAELHHFGERSALLLPRLKTISPQ